eukprot:360255-Chlamydomonas_euryale.AAC.19
MGPHQADQRAILVDSRSAFGGPQPVVCHFRVRILTEDPNFRSVTVLLVQHCKRVLRGAGVGGMERAGKHVLRGAGVGGVERAGKRVLCGAGVCVGGVWSGQAKRVLRGAERAGKRVLHGTRRSVRLSRCLTAACGAVSCAGGRRPKGALSGGDVCPN